MPDYGTGSSLDENKGDRGFKDTFTLYDNAEHDLTFVIATEQVAGGINKLGPTAIVGEQADWSDFAGIHGFPQNNGKCTRDMNIGGMTIKVAADTCPGATPDAGLGQTATGAHFKSDKRHQVVYGLYQLKSDIAEDTQLKPDHGNNTHIVVDSYNLYEFSIDNTKTVGAATTTTTSPTQTAITVPSGPNGTTFTWGDGVPAARAAIVSIMKDHTATQSPTQPNGGSCALFCYHIKPDSETKTQFLTNNLAVVFELLA
jgi:hypothetical protein